MPSIAARRFKGEVHRPTVRNAATLLGASVRRAEQVAAACLDRIAAAVVEGTAKHACALNGVRLTSLISERGAAETIIDAAAATPKRFRLDDKCLEERPTDASAPSRRARGEVDPIVSRAGDGDARE